MPHRAARPWLGPLSLWGTLRGEVKAEPAWRQCGFRNGTERLDPHQQNPIHPARLADRGANRCACCGVAACRGRRGPSRHRALGGPRDPGGRILPGPSLRYVRHSFMGLRSPSHPTGRSGTSEGPWQIRVYPLAVRLGFLWSPARVWGVALLRAQAGAFYRYPRTVRSDHYEPVGAAHHQAG